MGEQEALVEYLRGNLSLRELESAVAESFEFEFRNDSRQVTCKGEPDFDIKVTPRKLRPVLEAYLAGEKSAEDVSIWASVIALVPAYIPPSLRSRRNDPGRYMWHLLYDLSAPPVSLSVTHTTVRRVLRKLESVERDLNGDR